MQTRQEGSLVRRQQLLQLALLHAAWTLGSGQLRYSVPEESQHGAFVGRIAQDLGLEVGELVPRMFRMESEDHRDYFEVNVQNGILFVNSRIDREELCVKSPVCTVHLEVIVDKPLRVFHVEVEIKDINDNAPIFPVNVLNLFISEATAYGSRFSLESASDADIGKNSLIAYQINTNEYFALDTQRKHGKSTSPEIVLEKALDREDLSSHHLLLTATDGGQPELTGTLQVAITVLDANDNRPVFNHSVYEVSLPESAANGTLVVTLEATDLDEGINKDIVYGFKPPLASTVERTFAIDRNTGEVRLTGRLDFEEVNLYEIQVQAIDKGHPPMGGDCKLLIEVLDVNDNGPEMSLKSIAVPVPEDSPPGTVVALISVSDKDAGANGQVSCSLWPLGLPFKLQSTFKNYYSLVVAEQLDREQVAEYKLRVTAQDHGAPSLSATSELVLPLGDVNDNAPTFAQPSYVVFVRENNPPGAHIFTVSASDPDLAENALLSYWMDEKLWPLASYISWPELLVHPVAEQGILPCIWVRGRHCEDEGARWVVLLHKDHIGGLGEGWGIVIDITKGHHQLTGGRERWGPVVLGYHTELELRHLLPVQRLSHHQRVLEGEAKGPQGAADLPVGPSILVRDADQRHHCPWWGVLWDRHGDRFQRHLWAIVIYIQHFNENLAMARQGVWAFVCCFNLDIICRTLFKIQVPFHLNFSVVRINTKLFLYIWSNQVAKGIGYILINSIILISCFQFND
ncbi:Protocadherin alpha-3 [Varanus komodoensis]|nr:Protocadherin alpha-3 [Varanus komodoensis]